MTFIFRSYYFPIIMKNLSKCNILKTFALKNNGKFADHNLELLCSWSLALASNIPVLGLESVCPRKVGPWPWLRIFFCVLGLEVCVLDSTPADGVTPSIFCKNRISDVCTCDRTLSVITQDS